jgi:hypothetical protein
LSVGTIVLVYLIGKELFGRETGLLAAALLAILPGAIYFARIEHYSFFVALTVWAYNRWLPERRYGYLGLATASNLIGLGFSFAAPVVAVPATLVLAAAHRDLRGQAVLISTTLLALAGWLAYVELRVGLDSLQTRDDSPFLWLEAGERSLWADAALTFFFKMFTPVALAGAAVWLVSLLDRRSTGDLVLVAWVAGMTAWLVSAPYHSRIHDFWWLPLATPLALILARVALNVLSSVPARAAAAVLVLGFTAWLSAGETQEYLDRREHGVSPVEFGQAMRPYLRPGDTMIGWYPNEIFYAGIPGYISGMIPDEQAYLAILAEDRPALIVLAGNDPAWFYQRAWDAGYRPLVVLGWNVYFREDTANLAAAASPEWQATLTAIAGLDAGSLLRAPDGATIYYYDWGLKMAVPPATVATLGIDAGSLGVQQLPSAAHDALPVGPAIAPLHEDSVVAGLDGRRFVVRGGIMHSVESDAALKALGLADAPVTFLPDGLIALVPEGDVLGSGRP